MKKILLFFVAAFGAIASWAADATVSATVSGQQLKVALANDAQAFVAFQMDITLPSGVTVNDADAVTMNTGRLTANATKPFEGAENSDFIIAYHVIDPAHVRVIAYNLANRALEGDSGELFTVQFEGTPAGNFTIDNCLFVTTTNLEEIKLALATSTEASYVPGDVTGDGYVTAADIVAVVNIINGTDDPSFNYNYEAANCSGDAIISAADIVAIVNLINQ